MSGHFGTSAEMSGHFGTITVVPKCLRSEVSWVRSVLTPPRSQTNHRTRVIYGGVAKVVNNQQLSAELEDSKYNCFHVMYHKKIK